MLQQQHQHIESEVVTREQSKYDGIAPVMLISRKEEYEIFSLDCGAGNCICKPVELMKLQVRVRKMPGMYGHVSLAAR